MAFVVPLSPGMRLILMLTTLIGLAFLAIHFSAAGPPESAGPLLLDPNCIPGSPVLPLGAMGVAVLFVVAYCLEGLGGVQQPRRRGPGSLNVRVFDQSSPHCPRPRSAGPYRNAETK